MKVLLVGVIEKYMCNDPTRFFEPETEYTTLDADPDVKADYHADIRWNVLRPCFVPTCWSTSSGHGRRKPWPIWPRR